MSNNDVAGDIADGISSNRNDDAHQRLNTSRAMIPKEMTYHYSGKVHVRGLLRRVWRPRFLALGDDGYLRYHESIPPLYQQQQQNPHPNNLTHTHRPKTILAILDGARTIDPNSVVDQHVALPQGVYGFVFRGRPVELYTTTNTSSHVIHSVERGIDNTEQQQGALIVPPGDTSNADQGIKAAVVNTVFPKGKAII